MAADRRRWLGLVAIAAGVAMIIVDATIVNVALPPIIRDLQISSTQAQWVQEAYTLVFAALLLLFGRLADQHGRRRLFIAGVALFVAASAVAAFAPSGGWLIGSRFLQGVGGAMVLPTSLSLINAGFRGRERGIAFAIWGSTIGGTAALGPLLGGWLTSAFSWRWAFAVNIPIGAAVVAGALLWVAESVDEDAPRQLDGLGALYSVVAAGGIVYGLIEGRTDGWWTTSGPVDLGAFRWTWSVSPVPLALAVGLVATALFVHHVRRRTARGEPALLDTSLFTIRSFRNGNIAAAIVSLGEFGLLFALPLWFQYVRGYSAFQTGLALLPLATGSFVASGLAAPLTSKWGAVWSVRLGILLELLGIAALGLVVGPQTAWWPTVPCLFVYGVGVGLATAQLTGVVLADVPVARSGQGSATQSTARQVGSALGIAILGTVLFSTLQSQLAAALTGVPGLPAGQQAGLVTAVTRNAGAAIGPLGANPHTAAVAGLARASLSTATQWAAFCAAGFLLVGLLATFSLGRAGTTTSPSPTPEPR